MNSLCPGRLTHCANFATATDDSCSNNVYGLIIATLQKLKKTRHVEWVIDSECAWSCSRKICYLKLSPPSLSPLVAVVGILLKCGGHAHVINSTASCTAAGGCAAIASANHNY